MRHAKQSILLATLLIIFNSCGDSVKKEEEKMESIKIMTLDPGHFHAALVQKNMYSGVSNDLFVFAPESQDVVNYLARIDSYNNRKESPTEWNINTYTGDDFFEQMIIKRPGNVVVLSGNNGKKSEYILKSVEAGINILADKPMIITPDNFPSLELAFTTAEKNGVLLYDIMTERHEITSMLQKALAHTPSVFGDLKKGSADEPAVTKESVHHFFKYVSGSPLKRPAWFFDTDQQGEGIVDVTTHLVDLIQWECFPEVILQKSDIEMVTARRWPTIMTVEEFEKVTGYQKFPEYLQKNILDDNLNVYSNGEMIYKIKDVYAKVVVEWRYQAPEGTGDTHYSIMRGTLSDLIISQGAEEGFKPTLYIKQHNNDESFSDELTATLSELPWEGITAEMTDPGYWKVTIPDRYKIGHEAHFGQVTEKYIQYLKSGKLPDWEVPNMIVKYYTTIEALKLAGE
ncbi:MAG: oxidoreductase [Bacteroidales bacterium]|nr:oxidoreductase [Bacteroidales bacterium]